MRPSSLTRSGWGDGRQPACAVHARQAASAFGPRDDTEKHPSQSRVTAFRVYVATGLCLLRASPSGVRTAGAPTWGGSSVSSTRYRTETGCPGAAAPEPRSHPYPIPTAERLVHLLLATMRLSMHRHSM